MNLTINKIYNSKKLISLIVLLNLLIPAPNAIALQEYKAAGCFAAVAALTAIGGIKNYIDSKALKSKLKDLEYKYSLENLIIQAEQITQNYKAINLQDINLEDFDSLYLIDSELTKVSELIKNLNFAKIEWVNQNKQQAVDQAERLIPELTEIKKFYLTKKEFTVKFKNEIELVKFKSDIYANYKKEINLSQNNLNIEYLALNSKISESNVNKHRAKISQLINKTKNSNIISEKDKQEIHDLEIVLNRLSELFNYRSEIALVKLKDDFLPKYKQEIKEINSHNNINFDHLVALKFSSYFPYVYYANQINRDLVEFSTAVNKAKNLDMISYKSRKEISDLKHTLKQIATNIARDSKYHKQKQDKIEFDRKERILNLEISERKSKIDNNNKIIDTKLQNEKNKAQALNQERKRLELKNLEVNLELEKLRSNQVTKDKLRINNIEWQNKYNNLERQIKAQKDIIKKLEQDKQDKQKESTQNSAYSKLKIKTEAVKKALNKIKQMLNNPPFNPSYVDELPSYLNNIKHELNNIDI